MAERILALGLMSGTALDGIDVALIETDGEDFVRPVAARTFPYTHSQRARLREALAAGATLESRTDRPGNLGDIEAEIDCWHAAAVKDFFSEAKMSHYYADVQVVGYHGQTILHWPEQRLTVQLGNGQTLARAIGIPVVYDLRAADMAAGGQGAPLVPVYHRALAGRANARPLVFLNIGGVANLTFVGANGALIAFDTGPGNALLDDWMVRMTGRSRDDNGALAASGTADMARIEKILAHPFFKSVPPKSLDRNSFAGLDLAGLSAADGAATLTALTVACVAAGAALLPQAPARWLVCGGGRHNGAMMAGLRSALINVDPVEAIGLDGDSLEAEAWAYLAVRSVAGQPLTFPGTTGVPRPVTGGVLVLPGAETRHVTGL